jgi:hypothetical protein
MLAPVPALPLAAALLLAPIPAPPLAVPVPVEVAGLVVVVVVVMAALLPAAALVVDVLDGVVPLLGVVV